MQLETNGGSATKTQHIKWLVGIMATSWQHHGNNNNIPSNALTCHLWIGTRQVQRCSSIVVPRVQQPNAVPFGDGGTRDHVPHGRGGDQTGGQFSQFREWFLCVLYQFVEADVVQHKNTSKQTKSKKSKKSVSQVRMKSNEIKLVFKSCLVFNEDSLCIGIVSIVCVLSVWFTLRGFIPLRPAGRCSFSSCPGPCWFSFLLLFLMSLTFSKICMW